VSAAVIGALRPPSSVARRGRALAVVVALALLGSLVAPPAPAHANPTVQTGNTQRVLGGLTSQSLDIRLANGQRVRGNALRFRDAADLELRPHLAGGTVAGLQTMGTMISREYTPARQDAKGAVAGVNGGYFLNRPWGAPNGLFVQSGRMLASDAVMASGGYVPRAVAGIAQNGAIVGDRIRITKTIDASEANVLGVELHDLNRAPLSSQTDRIVLYDTRYGASAPARANSVVLVLDELRVRAGGAVEGRVRERFVPTTDRNYQVSAGTSVLVASGATAAQLAPITVGHAVRVTTQIAPATAGTAADWVDLRGAIPGAGLLVKNGVVQSGASHADQAINHASTRRARTAVGRTGNGHTLLVTVDETGGSPGLTLFELGVVMRELGRDLGGMVDAVALDGGGSTTMAVNGRVANRPSDPNRGHSSALFVYAPLPPAPRTVAAACPSGQVPSAGFRDIGGNTHATAIDCLAWWDVTQGLTPTSYGPAGTVTRQQMASFLARWLDDLAARGTNLRAVPDAADNPFTDVRTGSTHERAISRLASVGIITGTTATTFNPAGNVSRAQTAALVDRALAYARGASLPDARDTFVDDNGNRHEPTIDRLAHAGVIGGTGGYNFSPDQPVTRAAMASLVMRASDVLVSEGRVTPPRG
jgi:hypothetical protein